MVHTRHTFDESFFEEEERCGFRVDRKRKELWAVELDLLYELERVCRKLGLRYFLDSGTLLGAVRDGSFIPWDDDIDVVMLRKDYDLLLEKGAGEFEAPYLLQTAHTDPGSFRWHAQLRNGDTAAILPYERHLRFNQGIFLDIFPLDDLTEEKLAAQYRRRERIRVIATAKRYAENGTPLRRAVKYMIRFMAGRKSLEALFDEYNDVFRQDTDSEYVDQLTFWRRKSEVVHRKRSWYREAVYIPFGDGMFPASPDAREYLTVRYGADYMTPKRMPSYHEADGDIIYDTDRPYTVVLAELNRKQTP